MTSATDILRDAFDRIHTELPPLLEGLDPATVLWRPDPDANSIGWLAWHLIRVQDDHLAGVGDLPQVWADQGFADRFGLPYPVEAHGYGHTSDDVGAFGIGDTHLLCAYHDAVHTMTLSVLDTLDADGYARIVDTSWDPPVTAAVRLVSVIGDTQAHLGQIGYVRGLAERAGQ
ncbi:MAG: mycothiol transferase [Propioniciclava sp.]